MRTSDFQIQKDVPLSSFTTFKIGGPAKFFIEVDSPEALSGAYQWGQKKNLSIFILGGGSNVLFPDEGYDGLVIKISLESYFFPKISYQIGRKYVVKAGSGVAIAFLAKEASKCGLRGLEWAGGLPGTVGGAVRGNAGAFRFEIGENVKTVEIYHEGEIRALIKEECVFGYRTSLFKSILGDAVIVSVDLELKAGNKEESQKELEGFLRHRGESQPPQPSAGCVFKNYLISAEALEKLSPRLKAMMPDNFWEYKKIPAAWLVEQAGMKGAQVGQAVVSPRHANFIVNLGGTSAQDVLWLIKKIKETVWQKFGVVLEEEIQTVRMKKISDNNNFNFEI